MKPALLKYVTVGLSLLLTACSGAAAGQPAPAETVLPAAEAEVKTTPVQTPAQSEMAQKSAPAQVTQKPAARETPARAAGDSAQVEPEAPLEKPLAKVEETGPAPAASQDTGLTESGPTPAQAQLLAGLGSRGQAPELNNEIWLNSDPLKLAHLHGKVVLLEFWTFG